MSDPAAPARPTDAHLANALLVTDAFVERYGSEVRSIAPDRPLVVLGEAELGEELLATVEVANFWVDDWTKGSRPYVGAAMRCPNLRWFHSMSAGVDSPFFGGLLEQGVRLTTSSGAAAPAIAQHVIMTMLALARDLPGAVRAQSERRWRRSEFGDDLDGASLLVVGLGPIGLEVARLAAAFGMSVTGARRTPDGTEGFPVHRLDEFDALLPEADWIVLALPLVDSTTHIFSTARMARCRPGVRVINIGRGGLIDEPALIAALQSGVVGGAALDVFATEPLPAESPLWELPGVIITPHSSAAVPSTRHRQAVAFIENLALYESGASLRNEVLL